ncbi:hypothetical protein OS493_012910 [Desmophyllum pertusum]|uniref:Uncharacterized protein n=1 Tax=Desmophyllum pertusum TaxID=174260 RepID=A0A9X0CTX8_9CNID|nr:hypothetical protein OS493_012910 [Desmophyllum pertusum]
MEMSSRLDFAFMLKEYIIHHPGAYLREALKFYLKRFAYGYRLDLTQQFMANMSIFTSEEMVFLDEGGFDRRLVRQYGHGPRGWRIRAPIARS